ncbi:MAG TPA: sodium:proton antiporter, partial [Ignavibacteriaceae bacterium]|nr:sodium:proton antiporter [Ignavibacteriaceae bacterium]
MKPNILLTLTIAFFLILSVDSFSTGSQDGNHFQGNNQVTVNNGDAHSGEGHELPSGYMVIPFVVLLLMIATGPIMYHHFWERNYPKVAIILGLFTTAYYLFVLHDTHSVLHTVAEYLSFIALLSSLFVASGGILIKVDKKATPMVNILFFLFGGVLANIIGTTGA